MITCRICHFEAELDDVVLVHADGRGICLRCYGRETGSARPLPLMLRRDLIATLAAFEAA